MLLSRQLAAEAAGSFFLLATVVGSGIMAEKLAGGNAAIALLGNTIPTGAMLVVLITMFGPVSGAHFNPAVTMAARLRGEMDSLKAINFIVAQTAGAVAGVWAAHAMFGLDILQVSAKVRTGADQWFAEVVASFGLLTVIYGTLRANRQAVATNVGLYITAAYWFTASTSFANPAVTLARSLTDSFSGIKPQDVAGFVAAQLAGATLAVAFDHWFTAKN